MEGVYAEILALRLIVQRLAGEVALKQPEPQAFLDKLQQDLIRAADTYNLEGAHNEAALRGKAKAAVVDMIDGIHLPGKANQ